MNSHELMYSVFSKWSGEFDCESHQESTLQQLPRTTQTGAHMRILLPTQKQGLEYLNVSIINSPLDPNDSAIAMSLAHDAPQDVSRGWVVPRNSVEGQVQSSAGVSLSCEERYTDTHVQRTADRACRGTLLKNTFLTRLLYLQHIIHEG